MAAGVIADRRCSVGERNARILGPDGVERGRHCLGDGINHLQCDGGNSIWVGYLDKGVFGGNLGWGGSDGPTPVGWSGLNRFGRDGELLWRFAPTAFAPPVDIDDCYTLNVADDGVWRCPYSDFPILRITPGISTHWQNTISGAHALAVDFPHVLLVGGYREAAGRAVLVRLEGGHCATIRQFDIEFPTGAILARGAPVVARGDTVHFVDNDTWYRLRVAELVQSLNPPTSPRSC